MNASLTRMVAHPGLSGLGLALRVVEPLMMVLLAYVALWLRLGDADAPSVYIGIVLMGATLYAAVGGMAGLYKHHVLAHRIAAVPRLVAVLLVVFAFIVALMFLFKISSTFSRIWLVVWLGLTAVGLAGLRLMLHGYIWRQFDSGAWSRRVVVLGTGAKAMELVRQFEQLPSKESILLGLYALDEDSAGTDLKHTGLYRGNLNKLLADGRDGAFDDLIVALDFDSAPDMVNPLLDKLYELTVNVYYCLPLPLFGRNTNSLQGIGNIPLVLMFRRPLEGPSIAMKRAMDMVVSGGILLVISPLMVVLAVLVKMSSPGPVFFQQPRNGFNGKEFGMLKFRSMRVGEAPKDESGKEKQATKDDPRITPIGAFLRRSSLDELPQLINILKGDMSLIGPRPHAVSHNTYYETLIDRYASRHKMKPGLTGWAQVNGWRGETETLEKMAKRVEFDIWYIENWSLGLDIRILILTPLVVLFQKTAY